MEGVPQGKVQQFQIDSKDCKLFNPGVARDVFGIVDPNNPKTLIVETHPIDYKRTVTVYVPAQYAAGTAAPFIVTHDGPALGKADMNLPHILDNLIAQKRVPAIIAIMISSGGGDAQGALTAVKKAYMTKTHSAIPTNQSIRAGNAASATTRSCDPSMHVPATTVKNPGPRPWSHRSASSRRG